MKQIMSVALVAALMGGTLSAQAAVNATAAKKEVKKVAKKKAVKEEVASTATVAAPAQTTMASTSVVSPNPLALRVYMENEFEAANAKQSGVRTGTSYLYVQATYKIDSDTSFRINQEFAQSFEKNVNTNRAERTQAVVGNTYLQLAKSNLFKIGNTPINSYVRTYLPTSIATRKDANQYLEVRGELNGKIIDSGKFSMTANTHARAYLGEAYNDKGEANKKYRLRNYVSGEYAISDNLSFLQQAGVQHTFKVDKTGGQPGLYAYSELGYAITSNFDVALGAYSLKPMNRAADLALYSAEGPESLYYLNAGYSF